MHVEVVRSARRRRTVELRPVPGGVRISIPASASKEEEEKYVSSLLRRYERRQKTKTIDLRDRSRKLAEEYDLLTPTSIEWVDNQNSRWGSCTPAVGSIRISSAVSSFPGWVIDYVIVHELAHLSVPGHGPRFWNLVERYPRSERARGFLIAKGLEGNGTGTGDDHGDDIEVDTDTPSFPGFAETS
jgi:predicted metal-dependent hydrolase